MSRFSRRQVVTIVVAVSAAVVLTPTVVYAAGGSSVTITDPTHPARKAHVTSSGKLLVGDRNGPLTIDGTVNARPVAPAHPWNPVNYVSVSSGSPRDVLFQANNPTKLDLTSFTVAATGSGAGTVQLSVQVYVSSTSGGDCQTLGGSFGAAERFLVYVPVGQTTNVTYPTPLVYTAYGSRGDKYCVDVEGSGPSGYIAYVSASGFTS